MTGCFTCRNTADVEAGPIRERIWWDGRWRVAHAIGCALAGWVVAAPARHVVSLADLDPAEAAALGPLLTAVSRAVVEVTGCVKTYVALFAEAERYQHVHVHVIPRYRDLPDGLRGPGVFDYLDRPESEWVTVGEMERISAALAGRLRLA